VAHLEQLPALLGILAILQQWVERQTLAPQDLDRLERRVRIHLLPRAGALKPVLRALGRLLLRVRTDLPARAEAQILALQVQARRQLKVRMDPPVRQRLEPQT
jgi:hypothetical protein